MLSRALLIALSCAYAAAVAPLSAAGDDNECALYLTGPGRTSAYDYSLNLLKGNFGYEGQHTCVTYDAVNQAYLEARNRIVVSQPKGDWKAEDFASVGELLLDISISLARTYGLTYEEIEKGLPLIDTSRTLIREVCPPIFSHVECRAGKYRRLDGLCTNLQHPTWGATMSPFQRLIGPLFADGINAPRIAHTGRDLPLSRVVSRTMHPDEGFHDHAGTVMVIAWGQFMDHDYTLTGTPLDPVNRNDPEECCKRPPHLKHPYCNEIRVPDDDYFYRLFGVKCIDFVRGFPSPRPGCRLGSRVPFNTLTGVIDGNTVYGVTEKFARKLRTGYGGLLRMNPVFKEYGLKDLLPLKLDIPDEGCTRPNKNMYCFEAGEIRVNEQLVLTVMHTLMAREHNRVARGLAEVNPHWDDETLFQEARRINIAEIQHITYNEFLPILLGKDVMEKFGLVLQKDGYWNGYDPEVNPDVIDSFAAAAYRFGHSLLPTAVERWSKAHKFIASKRLSDLIRRPYDLYRAGVLDEYVMGLMNQVAQAMDDSITQEVTNHLFKKVGARFGMDLVSFNMQRGREFGLPGYMEFRKFCGLSGAETFQDLFGSMPNETVRKYESIFEHPIDVDLWSGGVSERPLPGSMLGPTFACIIATQFSYSRRGDRFWYELPNQPSSFTPEQLTELRKARLARVICDNTDIIDTVQLYPMVLPDHELNPRVPCRSGIMPSIDFTKWAEPAPFQGSAKQFITEMYIPPKTELSCEEDAANLNTTSENSTIVSKPVVPDNKVTDKADINPVTKNSFTLTINVSTNKKAENNDQVLNKETVTESDCPESIVLNGNNKDNDKVLNYVYNKTEKNDIIQKKNGHFKNSLQRRKRSVNAAPLIVNYETSHGPDHLNSHKDTQKSSKLRISPEPSHIEITEPAHQQTAGNVIKNSHLADFNIETLHEKDGQPVRNNENVKADFEIIDTEKLQHNKESDQRGRSNGHHSLKDSEESSEGRENNDSNESRELEETKTYSNDNRQRSDDKERSSFREGNDKKIEESNSFEKNHIPLKKRTSVIPNEESNEKDNFRQDKKIYSDESDENYERKEKRYPNESAYQKAAERPEQEESNESNSKSKEYNEKESSESSKYSNNENSSEESTERNKDDNNSYRKDQPNIEKSNSVKPYNSRYSSESSNESKENKDSYENEKYESKNQTTPLKIRDTDLGDFSYERIEVNDKGEVVPAKDSDKETLSSPSKSKIIDEENNENLSLSKEDSSSQSSIEGNDDKELVRINDGEIKPVVEINADNNSGEFLSNKEPINSNIKVKDQSLEEFLDVKDLYKNDQNEKLTVQDETDKEDVKQQVERIPLHYDHDKSKEKNENQQSLDQPQNTKDPNFESQVEISEGTIETIPTESPKYDEHLHFKFDDVAVSLPEIKLPEDILAYAYEEPHSEKQKKKNDKSHKNNPKFYHYGALDSDEDSKNKKPDDDTHTHGHDDDDDDEFDRFYGIYKNKDNYKNKNEKEEEQEEEDDNVDLYEKFVRERFGKRGTFEQRSEKLQDLRPVADPNLYERINKVLKKTHEIEKQAQKSGDPNAGYMWTLEYGQKL